MSSEGQTFGPMLVGVFLNCILYGVTAVQSYIYFQTYKRDERWMKMFVIYLLFCETLNTVFDIGVVYEPLIIRYGTPQVLTNAPIMLATNPLLTGMISLPVQLFIAWRVKVMSKSSILPAIIAFLAIAAFTGCVATMAALISINFEYSRFYQNDGAVITWLASSAIADVVITGSLVYSLMRKRTGFTATDGLINRIVRLTVQTGLITAVAATLDVTLFLLLRGRTWNFMWDLPLSKLYSNSILSTLNARGGWKSTSTIQNNVLFGNDTCGGNVSSSRTQIEIMTTEIRGHRDSGAVAMKAFDSECGYGRNDFVSAINVNVVPRFVQDM